MSHQDFNINSSSAHELFPQQKWCKSNQCLESTDYQDQLMSHQGGHTDIYSLEELIAQWNAFIQDQHYDQHQLMIH